MTPHVIEEGNLDAVDILLRRVPELDIPSTIDQIRGIASHLADYQEQWAIKQGYKTIWMKTRNRFPQMLLMATQRGFRITSLNPSANTVLS